MKKIILCALIFLLLIGDILCNKDLSLEAEAADGSSECVHVSFKVFDLSYSYPNANDSGHQKSVYCLCRCYTCGYSWYDRYWMSEPHTIDSVTNKCVCGYEPHHWTNM